MSYEQAREANAKFYQLDKTFEGKTCHIYYNDKLQHIGIHTGIGDDDYVYIAFDDILRFVALLMTQEVKDRFNSAKGLTMAYINGFAEKLKK